MLPGSIIIATHMDTVDHATVSRESLQECAENGIADEQLLIPDDGEILTFQA